MRRWARAVLLISGVVVASAGHAQPPRARVCHCFGWVHGPDHGTSCSTTRAACAAERRETSRDTTPCREVVGRATCEDEAFIDGRPEGAALMIVVTSPG